MAIGDWTEEDVKNGLRDPSGALVGGLNALDYAQGRQDFAAGARPPPVTTASYDLGRRRAAEETEEKADILARIEHQQKESDQRLRDILRDRPDLLAEYDEKMAAISRSYPTGNPKP